MVLGDLPNAPGTTQCRPVPPPIAARPSVVRQCRSIVRVARIARCPGSQLVLGGLRGQHATHGWVK